MMSHIKIILFLTLWSIGICAAQVEETSITTDESMLPSLASSLKGYLQRYLGHEASDHTVNVATNFLKSLKFIHTAQCSLTKNNGKHLHCSIKSKYYIKLVQVQNLPLGMLESELKRKLPVQMGQLIVPHDGATSEILSITKSRVETFLRTNGYYGAKINVSLKEDPKTLSAIVSIIIEGGVFARVNEVILEGDAPVSPRTVKMTFQRMCLAFNRIFEAFSNGTVNCYSRQSERDAIKKMQDRLAKMGYVQARISLTHRWLDPHSPSVPKKCQARDKNAVPFCVDLHVRIEKGPKVRTAINMREGTMVSRSTFSRFFGSIFAVDQLSRVVRALDEEVPSDRIIVKEELEKRINFIETKNVAEAELAESAQQMREYLISKGYTNADVVPSYYVENSENIVVNFDVYSGQSYYVKSFKLEPENFVEYFEPEELNNLFKTRGVLEQGQLSYDRINNALDEVKRRLSERGFRDVVGKMEMVSLDDGGIEVIFYLSSSKREFIDTVTILNGEEKLNKEIVHFLRNCSAVKMKKYDNDAPNLCKGSALDRENIVSDEKKIADFYVNNDFLFAKVKSELIESEHGYKLNFYVYDGRWGENSNKKMIRQEIKDVILSGNESVHSSVIKRLFPRASKKNRYDSISLKKGLALLRESGHFSNIDFKILVGQENSEDAYFALHVTEKPSLTLDTALAFSTDQLLSVEFELEESNLFSSMLRLNSNLGIGLFWGRQSFISNKFVWPFMFGGPFRFSLQAPVIVYDDKTSHIKPFRRLQSKVIASLEWRASPILMPYLRYSLTHTLRENFPNDLVPEMTTRERFASVDGLIPVFQAPGKIRGMLKPGISLISLDNPTDPHSGIDLNNFAELSGGPLVGDPFFLNLGTQNKFYIPLGSTTLALQLSFMRAFIQPNSSNWEELSEVSAMDNLGGDRRVRGYQEGTIRPSHAINDAGQYGGYVLHTSSIEWRFPLTSPELLGNFSGALFVDQGMVFGCKNFICIDDVSWNELVTNKEFGLSVGVGLRYNLPVGPISLDFAYSPLHNDWRPHLQFGYAF